MEMQNYVGANQVLVPHEFDSLVSDLLVYRPVIYWIDFLLSNGAGWTLLLSTLLVDTFSPVWFLLIIASSIPFYRAILFVHEISHFKHKKILSFFRIVWNVTCGMLFFLPDLTYFPHRYHHAVETYGTKADPEYIPLSKISIGETLVPFLVFLILPLLMAFRFLILSPLSWVLPQKFRDGVLAYGSTLVMNPGYKREVRPEERKEILLEESTTFVLWILIIGAFLFGFLPLELLYAYYILTVLLLTLNHFRSFAEHLYQNETGRIFSYHEQMMDSLVVEGPVPFVTFMTPIGLQYHTAHHMFPNAPYHSLGAIHYRLKAHLPPDHPYHTIIRKNMFVPIWKIFTKR